MADTYDGAAMAAAGLPLRKVRRSDLAAGSVSEYADLLSRVELFVDLDRIALAKLAAHLSPLWVPAGTSVVEEGEHGDSMYIVACGELEVVVATENPRSERRVATLDRGAPFGEMALLTSEPRAATVRTVGPAEVLRLERAQFLSLIREKPEVARSIAATLSRRLRRAQSARAVDAPSTAPSTAGSPGRARARGPLASLLAGAQPAWLFFAIALMCGWSLEPPLGLSEPGWRAVMSLLAVVPLLALGSLPEGVLALVLAGVWVIGDVAPLQAALGGFASTSWVLLVSVLVLGTAIASSGVLYRLALWTVARTSGGFVRQALALGVTGLFLGPAAPNATARVTLIAPAISELSDALGFAPRSRASAGLAMAAFAGFGQMTAPFLTSSTTAVLVFAVLPEEARLGLGWTSWAACALALHAVLFVGLMAAVVILYRPRGGRSVVAGDASPALALQRALLGRLTRDEILTVVVTVALLAGFVTQPLHGVHPAWLAVTAVAVLGAAGVVRVETLASVNWNFALLFGVLASMSAVFASAGVNVWITDMASDTMRDFAGRPVLLLAGFVLACTAVSLVLRWQAAAPLLTIAMAPLAVSAGIHPIVVAIVAVVACSGFLLPYQSTIYLALYHGTEGRLFSHAQARPFAIAFAAITLLAVVASVPYWRYLGLL